jgi:hypothetical protein
VSGVGGGWKDWRSMLRHYTDPKADLKIRYYREKLVAAWSTVGSKGMRRSTLVSFRL